MHWATTETRLWCLCPFTFSWKVRWLKAKQTEQHFSCLADKQRSHFTQDKYFKETNKIANVRFIFQKGNANIPVVVSSAV